MKTRNETARDFLNALVGPLPPDSCIEIRRKKPGGPGARVSFHTTTSIDVERMGIDENIWMGIVLRKAGTQSAGRAGDLTWAWAAWIDYDGLDDETKKQVAIQKLRRWSHPPTLIVDSGGGIHAYWRFTLPLDVSGQQSVYLREVCHGLAHALGADTSVHDLPRMMRVAGTYNPGNGKTKVYDPPREVRILHYDPRVVYGVSDLSQHRRPVTQKAGTRVDVPTNSISTPVLAALNVSQRIRDLIGGGWQTGGLYKSRSEADNAVCVALVEGGHSDADIFAVFRDPSYGVGEKYREKGTDGDRYLAATLSNAKDYIAMSKQQAAALLAAPVVPGIRERGGVIEADRGKEWVMLLNKPIRAIGRFTGAAEGFRVEIDSSIGTVYRTFTAETMATNSSFKSKALRNAAQWLGNERDVQLLAMYLDAQNPPLRHAIDVIGWAGPDLVIFPNMQLEGGVPSKNSEYLYAGHMEDARLVESDDWPALARTLLPLIADFQLGGAAVPVLGWYMASFLAPQLRRLVGDNSFPFLMVFGLKEAGKTDTLRLLRGCCGYGEVAAAGQETRFTSIDMISASNTLPALLDEYRPPEVHRGNRGLHELLRHAYQAGMVSRGMPDLSVRRYRLLAPVAIAGESPFRDGSLLDKAVHVRFEPGLKNEAAYNSALDLPREQFALGMYQYVRTVDIAALWEEAKRCLPAEFMDRAHIRQQKGWTTVAFGLLLMRDFFSPGVIDGHIDNLLAWRVAPHGDTAGSDKLVLREMVRIMTELIRQRRMRDGQEFVIKEENGENFLWFIPGLVLPMVEEHFQKHPTELPMTRETMLEYLRVEARTPDGFVAKYQDTVRVGNRTHRGIALSLEAIERHMQVSVDYWKQAAIMGSDRL